MQEGLKNVERGPGAGEGCAQTGWMMLQLSGLLCAAELREWEILDGCLLQRLSQSGLQRSKHHPAERPFLRSSPGGERGRALNSAEAVVGAPAFLRLGIRGPCHLGAKLLTLSS